MATILYFDGRSFGRMDKKLATTFREYVGPLSPDSYQQGRVAGLREAANRLCDLSTQDACSGDILNEFGWWLREQVEPQQARVNTLQNEIDTASDQIPPSMEGDSLSVALIKYRDQLTQRTAELEAAKAELNTVRRDAGLDCGDHSCLYAMNKTGMRTNGGCRCSPKHMKNDLGRSRKACDDLHAELERVRAALEDACLSVAVHGEQPPQKWLDALRHRQGMEG